MINLLIVAAIDFFFNIPFGYWRASEKTFSWQWFASIHIPIPFIVLLRHVSDIGFALYTYPIMLFSFFAGQFLGKMIYKKLSIKIKTSRNIFKDLIKFDYLE